MTIWFLRNPRSRYLSSNNPQFVPDTTERQSMARVTGEYCIDKVDNVSIWCSWQHTGWNDLVRVTTLLLIAIMTRIRSFRYGNR